MRRRTALLLCAALALGACAAPEKEPQGARMRALGELPEDYRELWRAWLAREPDWPARRARALSDPGQRQFLIDNLARELVQGYVAADLSEGHAAVSGRYERARAELLKIGGPAVPTFVELLAIADGAAAFPCQELLVALGEPAVEPVAGLLTREAPRARERAALTLAELPRSRSEEPTVRDALAHAATADPEWNVRAAAVRAVAARGARDETTAPARAVLLRALLDRDADVAREAADGLARLDDPAAVPGLINHLERCEREADVRGRQSVLVALVALTRTRGPRSAADWRAWWRDHGSRVQGGEGGARR